ncbi:hypothetical protein WN55_11276 [Dufourea novaeangliae]|uniref:Uncharacterized protein n=1 Tax=Dufourea novaeangliae TaxID=178035 RepID=A0A154P9S6_DUFNO|nr:hypothetical protein WN55_11276 [Dufourea novaeangliae]
MGKSSHEKRRKSRSLSQTQVSELEELSKEFKKLKKEVWRSYTSSEVSLLSDREDLEVSNLLDNSDQELQAADQSKDKDVEEVDPLDEEVLKLLEEKGSTRDGRAEKKRCPDSYSAHEDLSRMRIDGHEVFYALNSIIGMTIHE